MGTTKMKVLFVDDERFALEAITRMVNCEKLGVGNIYKAYSMKQAQDICRCEEPDIIYCDIEMPRGTGLEFVQWLRESGYLSVVIFITSHAVFEYAQEAIHLGAMEYLLKPLDSQQLEASLEKAVLLAREKRNDRRTLKRIQELDAGLEKNTENVQTVKAYIGEHLDERLTREELSALVYLNEDYLAKIFKEQEGLTLTEYIIHQRLKMARGLLTKSSLSISQIASEVGYPNLAYFTKLFKRYMGVTPKEYRRAERVEYAKD